MAPFNTGDDVRIISPTADRDKIGIVIEVLEPLGDLVYRYCVRLNDGSTARFFGFELSKNDSNSRPIDIRRPA